MYLYLRTKFQVSSIILTSIRKRAREGKGNFTPSLPSQNEPQKAHTN